MCSWSSCYRLSDHDGRSTFKTEARRHPISAVKEVDAGIRLTLTKDEVQALPPLDTGLPE